MMRETLVKCDECGWIKDTKPEEVLDWHNKPCPQCQRGVIINDQEAALFRKLLVISNVSDYFGKVYKVFTGKNAELVESNIDSSVLRKQSDSG